MWEADKIFEQIKQHDKLNIAIFSSNKKYQLSPTLYKTLLSPHRVYYYFMTFLEKGEAVQGVDFNDYNLKPNEILMIFPRQIYCPSIIKEQNTHYKLAFDNIIPTLLSQSFTFLLNPLNKQVLSVDTNTFQRIKHSLSNIEFLLSDVEFKNDTTLIISYLNNILVELSHCYYSTLGINYQNNSQLKKFIEFKVFVEDNLKEQYSVEKIATKIGVSTNSLYSIVKYYANLSPKEYINSKIILEAKRLIFHTNLPVKELAYGLGFNDPDYFSRLFKKHTNLTVLDFKKSVQDLSCF